MSSYRQLPLSCKRTTDSRQRTAADFGLLAFGCASAKPAVVSRECNQPQT